MDDILDDNVSGQGLGIGQSSKSFLLETAKWARFLAIVGFVMTALIVLIAIGAGFFMGSVMSEAFGSAGSSLGGIGIAFIYILLALIYFFPLLYLYRFATKMKVAIHNGNQLALDESFQNLKSCFKFMGIFTLVILIFYALMLVFGIGAGLMSSMF